MQQVKIADNDTLLGDLQQARNVQAQLLELQRQTMENGRPMTTELAMLIENMQQNMSQIETKLRLSGQEVPLNRSSSLSFASTPQAPPGDARLNARPQAQHQAFPSPNRGDTGGEMALVPAGSAPGRSASASQFQESLADGLAGMATADVAERAGGELRVGSIDVTDRTAENAHNEQGPPQGDDANDSSAEEDQAPQEQAQLLAPPALAIDSAVSGSAPTTASTTEASGAVKVIGADGSQSTAPAPLKTANIGGTASMLARLSAFKAQKAATTVAAPLSASPEEDASDEQRLATPAATADADTADVGEAREEQVAETVDKKLDAAADDAGTPLRPTTPPRRGQGAGAKSEAQKALTKKRAEIQRRKKAEAAKKQKVDATAGEAPEKPEPEPEPEPEPGSDLPGDDHAEKDSSATSSTDTAEGDRGERPVEETNTGQSKRTDIAAAIAARKRAAGKKAALQSKSNRAGAPPGAKGKSDDTKARILAAKAKKKKETPAQAKADTAP
jgi:hypothetical protein